MDNLNLPLIDPDEDTKMQLPPDLPQEVKLTDEEKKKKDKRMEMRNQFESLLQQMQNVKLNKGTKRYWRTITISIMAWFRVRKDTVKNKLVSRLQ